MGKNILEDVVSSLFLLQREIDHQPFEERLDYAFKEISTLDVTVKTESAYMELANLYEEKGFRDGFNAGMKLIMRVMEKE